MNAIQTVQSGHEVVNEVMVRNRYEIAVSRLDDHDVNVSIVPARLIITIDMVVDLWGGGLLFVLVRMCILAGVDMFDLMHSGPTIALDRVLSFHSDTDTGRYRAGTSCI